MLFNGYQLEKYLKIENIKLDLTKYGQLSDFITGVESDDLLGDEPITEDKILFQDGIGNDLKKEITKAIEQLRIKIMNNSK